MSKQTKKVTKNQQRRDDQEHSFMSISADMVVRNGQVYPVINVNGHKDIVVLLLVELYKFVQDKTGNPQKFHDDFDDMVTSETRFKQVALKKAQLAMKEIMNYVSGAVKAKANDINEVTK